MIRGLMAKVACVGHMEWSAQGHPEMCIQILGSDTYFSVGDSIPVPSARGSVTKPMSRTVGVLSSR
jgi:hypothetical protein